MENRSLAKVLAPVYPTCTQAYRSAFGASFKYVLPKTSSGLLHVPGLGCSYRDRLFHFSYTGRGKVVDVELVEVHIVC
ncbi:hypothetical protein C5167_042239 [Papaver somniferum]|uniref:Uncharacterized protein n=1 Tax=Papaver somniferum TaxID=3469 RepID=A0A4Y7L2A1_PAPSO|nr:hypothetical protein C5167_042239 [Papaver somniferum]